MKYLNEFEKYDDNLAMLSLIKYNSNHSPIKANSCYEVAASAELEEIITHSVTQKCFDELWYCDLAEKQNIFLVNLIKKLNLLLIGY